MIPPLFPVVLTMPSLPCTSLPQSGPFNPAVGLGERRKLPLRAQTDPGRQTVLCILAKNRFWMNNLSLSKLVIAEFFTGKNCCMPVGVYPSGSATVCRLSLVYRWDVVCRPGGRRLKLQEWTMTEEIAGGGQWRNAFQRVELSSHERRVSFAIIIFYYAIIAARQNKFDTHLDANASTKRQKKDKNSTK